MNNRSDQLNKFLERYYGYILAVVLILIAVVMVNFFIWPQYQTMQSAGILQYRNSAEVVSQRRDYLQQLQMMQTAYEALDQRVIRAVDVALPSSYSDGPAYAELEHLLDGTKFKIQSVNIAVTADTTTDSIYEPVSLSLNISAAAGAVSYGDFKTLLQRLEQNPHVMNLESMVYTPGTASYTFVLNTYQRKPSL